MNEALQHVQTLPPVPVGATITVYDADGTTLSTGLTNAAGGALTNPFVTADGNIYFRASNGQHFFTIAKVGWNGGVALTVGPLTFAEGINTGDQTALTVANTPAGNISAVTVQAALNELDAEKAPALGPDDNYVTDIEKVTLANTSGVNTGDQIIGGGGANGRIYYPQNSVASDLPGYKVASLTPSAGATSNISIVCPTQNAYVLGEEFATLVGEPNALSLPAGTAIRFLFAGITGGTAQIQSDLFQYKTTGDIATTGAVSLTFVDGGANADSITRLDGGSFIADGFTAGCKITVAGTVSNNGTHTVQAVSALALTLIISSVLVAELAVSTITTKEKLLRTGTSPAFTNSAVQLIQFFYTDATSHVLAADDRIILKWWGRRTNAGGSQTITIATEGVTTASYVQTTLLGITTAAGVSLAAVAGLTAANLQAMAAELQTAKQAKTSGAEITYSKAGDIAIVAGTLGRIVKRAGTITVANVRLGVAGVTGDTTLVVKNGATTVGSITLASGATTGNLTLTNPILAINDVLTVDCTANATTKAKDLSITFLLDLT